MMNGHANSAQGVPQLQDLSSAELTNIQGGFDGHRSSLVGPLQEDRTSPAAFNYSFQQDLELSFQRRGESV